MCCETGNTIKITELERNMILHECNWPLGDLLPIRSVDDKNATIIDNNIALVLLGYNDFDAALAVLCCGIDKVLRGKHPLKDEVCVVDMQFADINNFVVNFPINRVPLTNNKWISVDKLINDGWVVN